MPRDKTATYERIIRCMKKEFLTFGYEKASIKNASAFLPRRARCEAPSLLRGCDPPEALISDAGLYPTSETSFHLRIPLTTKVTRILRQRLKATFWVQVRFSPSNS